MTTVFQRCKARGYTDYLTCGIAGQLMAHWWTKDYVLGNRVLVESIEPHGTFKVWAYPDEFTDRIDEFVKKAANILAKDLKLPSEMTLIADVSRNFKA